MKRGRGGGGGWGGGEKGNLHPLSSTAFLLSKYIEENIIKYIFIIERKDGGRKRRRVEVMGMYGWSWRPPSRCSSLSEAPIAILIDEQDRFLDGLGYRSLMPPSEEGAGGVMMWNCLKKAATLILQLHRTLLNCLRMWAPCIDLLKHGVRWSAALSLTVEIARHRVECQKLCI